MNIAPLRAQDLAAHTASKSLLTLAHSGRQAFALSTTLQAELIRRALRSLNRKFRGYTAVNAGESAKAGATAISVTLPMPTATIGTNSKIVFHSTGRTFPPKVAHTSSILAKTMVCAIPHTNLEITKLPSPARLAKTNAVFTSTIIVAVLLTGLELAMLTIVCRGTLAVLRRNNANTRATTTAILFN